MRRFIGALVFSLVACSTPVTSGSTCSAESIGRCDGQQLLQCTDGAFVIYSDCKGPKGCVLTSETADCDTSGNSVGDRCPPPSEGKVRCDPDGGLNILRCVGGTLQVIDRCTEPRRCGINDAGLTCL